EAQLPLCQVEGFPRHHRKKNLQRPPCPALLQARCESLRPQMGCRLQTTIRELAGAVQQTPAPPQPLLAGHPRTAHLSGRAQWQQNAEDRARKESDPSVLRHERAGLPTVAPRRDFVDALRRWAVVAEFLFFPPQPEAFA